VVIAAGIWITVIDPEFRKRIGRLLLIGRLDLLLLAVVLWLLVFKPGAPAS